MERLKELLEKLTCSDCDTNLTSEEAVELKGLLTDQYNAAKDAENTDRQTKFAHFLAETNKAEEAALAAEEAAVAEEAARQAELDKLAGMGDEEPVVEDTEKELSEETAEETPAATVQIELGDFDLSQFRTAEETLEDESGDDEEASFLNMRARITSGAADEGARITNRADLMAHAMGVWESFEGRDYGKTYIAQGLSALADEDYAGIIDPARSSDHRHVTQVLWDVVETEQNNAVQEALVADGSFCAPIEPDLRFCDLTGPITGQLELPTVRAPRGRLQYMKTPNFADMLARSGIGETFTEADSIAVDPADDATWKQCTAIDCPTQQDPCSIEATYSCITYKHFTASAYPEYIDFFIRNALKVHVLKQNRKMIDRILAGPAVASTPDVLPAGVPNSTAGLLNVLSRRAYALREAYWLPRNMVLDVAAPSHVREMIRADIAIRQFGSPEAIFSVTDAQIVKHFSDRNLRVQWLENFERTFPVGTLANEDDGSIYADQLWPEDSRWLMWVPGSLVKMTAPNFDIGFDVIRDGALVRQNAYQGFVETFDGLCTPCDYKPLTFRLPFCPAGETSGPVAINCANLTEVAQP